MESTVNVVRALVRPVVTLSLTGAVIVLTLLGKISPDTLSASMGTALGFYFADRAATKRQQTP